MTPGIRLISARKTAWSYSELDQLGAVLIADSRCSGGRQAEHIRAAAFMLCNSLTGDSRCSEVFVSHQAYFAGVHGVGRIGQFVADAFHLERAADPQR
jgi:hypothetical protein